MSLAQRLAAAWYAPRLKTVSIVLFPLSLLFGIVSAARRRLYRARILPVVQLPVPVVVVGNITVGGSGKTPLVIALARTLAAMGFTPGVVSRGYGGSADAPRAVAPDSDPAVVGDEPVLIARAGFRVWIGRDRVEAGRRLLAAHPGCDVVLADDGLQHYRLARVVEIVAVGERAFGNRLLLPAGPLREPLSRLREVTAIVCASVSASTVGAASSVPVFIQRWKGGRFVRVDASRIVAPADRFRSGNVVALAGIGEPERFFARVRAMGIDAKCHAFPDHHRFDPADLAFPGATAILMTEKDAVKCEPFADDRCWMLPVRAVVDAGLIAIIEEKLRGSQTA